ncbi:J domain-containing protein [Kiloniella antarctica]|uniref:J domain-containing protein n=1 Tax=Kiloniella antarctica TaxID=1550907 RepID=A0ABW5BM18_9PROT
MNKKQHAPHLETPWDHTEKQNCCDVKGCPESGEFRAPKSRTKLNNYYWFCLKHVREYNATWNYCKDMGIEEVDNLRRNDAVWGKPTWPLNGSKPSSYAYRMDELGKAWRSFAGTDETQAKKAQKYIPEPERQAIHDLGLQSLESWKDIKKSYLKLVKELHPDTNGGLKSAEDQLKKVNLAYSLLKKSIFVKETLQETGLTP